MGSESREQFQHGLAYAVDAVLRDRAQVVARLVKAVELEVDQVDRGHAALQEGNVVVEDAALRRLWERRPCPSPLGSTPQLSPEPGTRVFLARDRQVLLAHEVEQHHP